MKEQGLAEVRRRIRGGVGEDLLEVVMTAHGGTGGVQMKGVCVYATGWAQGGAAVWAVLRVGAQTAEEGDDGQLGQQRKQAAMRESHVSGDAAITKRRAPKPRGGSLRKTDLNPSLGLLGLLKTFRAVPLGVTQSPGCTDTHREEPEGQRTPRCSRRDGGRL